jgi:RNA polymerase sigma-70 factor (ECF subfamily)
MEIAGSPALAMPRMPTDPALQAPAAESATVVPLRQTAVAGGTPVEAADVGERMRALVGSARQGDLDAWSRLYIETFDVVLKHVCCLTGDASLAEDLVQDAYARAMSNIGQYDGRAPFVAWLRGIALNVVRMHWRRTKTTDRVHDRLRELVIVTSGGIAAGPDRVHQQDQRARLLYQLLATLPENLREAFVLRELEGLPPTEAAAALGISEGNLAVRASRARARIRQELERLGWTEATP